MTASIDLDFRPRSYFWPMSAEKHLLATIHGAERRRMVKAAFSNTDLDFIDMAFFAKSSLSEDERTAMGALTRSSWEGNTFPICG